MKLSQHYSASDIERDGEFSRLGYVDAEHPGALAYADNVKYCLKAQNNPNVSCLIITPELARHAGSVAGLLISKTPRQAFYQMHLRFIQESLYALPFEPGRGQACHIHPSAVVSAACLIGDDVVIGEQAVVRDPVWIGSGVIIEPGSKIGVEGILYEKTANGNRLIPHAGYVRIHDHVSLMTNSVVVRSIHDTDVTEVGQGAIVGLNSVVGHEAKIGASAVISNHCVVARRSRVGKHAFLGTSVTVKEHVRIGDNAKVMAGSVVVNDLPENSSVSGNFATDHKHRMLEFARNKGSRSTRS